MELLKLNLAVEADLRVFTGLVVDIASRLGGSRFSAAKACIDLFQQLRRSGAGSGYPLPAILALDERYLVVQWEQGPAVTVTALPAKPGNEEIETLRQEIQLATQSQDPELLLERNRQMTRNLEQTRRNMERELATLQKALERRQEELKESLRKAETDALTSLFNRRAFDERIVQSFRRTVRQRNEHLSLILLDLDFFKEINDKHGHPFGDEHLRRMASVLRSTIRRDVDFAFRLGGDEFALLMFVDRTTACAKALQILENMDYQVSIGICSINGHDSANTSVESFVSRADNALYVAKRTGRGRVMADGCTGFGGSGCTTNCMATQGVLNG